MNFIQKLLMRWVGPSFLGRVATTIVSAILAMLAKYGFDIPADTLVKFSESTEVILSIIFASLVSGGIDAALSKKDRPETPELIK